MQQTPFATPLNNSSQNASSTGFQQQQQQFSSAKGQSKALLHHLKKRRKRDIKPLTSLYQQHQQYQHHQFTQLPHRTTASIPNSLSGSSIGATKGAANLHAHYHRQLQKRHWRSMVSQKYPNYHANNVLSKHLHSMERMHHNHVPKKWKQVRKVVQGTEMLLWKTSSPIQFIKFSKAKLQSSPGYLEDIFPKRSDMKTDSHFVTSDPTGSLSLTARDEKSHPPNKSTLSKLQTTSLNTQSSSSGKQPPLSVLKLDTPIPSTASSDTSFSLSHLNQINQEVSQDYIQSLWFNTMHGRLMTWNLKNIDDYILQNHFGEKKDILESLRKHCKDPVELLRAVFVLACKYEWSPYHVRDYLRELDFPKVWVCEGVLRGYTDNQEEESDSHMMHDEVGVDRTLEEEEASPSIDDSSKEQHTQCPTFRPHSWVVVQFSRGPDTSDGEEGVLYIMDIILGRLTADASTHLSDAPEAKSAANATSNSAMDPSNHSSSSKNNTQSAENPSQTDFSLPPKTEPTTSSDVIDSSNLQHANSHSPSSTFNDFWFLVPPMMLRFTHFASRVKSREILTNYGIQPPRPDPSSVAQSSTAELYPQSVQEFEQGPNININALYLGVFPRNLTSRLSEQVVDNYVKLEFDSVTQNKIDVCFRITSLDENPFKEAYHIWESYPTSNQLMIHFIFRSRGVYKVEVMMCFNEHDAWEDESVATDESSIEEEFSFVPVFEYVFHVKKSMKRDVGGFNASVFHNMNFHDLLHQVETPLQRNLQVNTVYNFQVLLNKSMFQGAALLLNTSPPVQAVHLEQTVKHLDMSSQLQLFEATAFLERKRIPSGMIHLVAFLKNDPKRKHPVHISSWDVVSSLPLMKDEVPPGIPAPQDLVIKENTSQIEFERMDVSWLEENLLDRTGQKQHTETTAESDHPVYSLQDDVLPSLSAKEHESTAQIPSITTSHDDPDIIILETPQQKEERIAREKRFRFLNRTYGSKSGDTLSDEISVQSDSTASVRGVRDTVSEKLQLLMPTNAHIDFPIDTHDQNKQNNYSGNVLVSQTMSSFRRLSSVGVVSSTQSSTHRRESSSMEEALSPSLLREKDVDQMIEKAQQRYAAQDYEEAIDLWSSVIKTQPDNEEVLYDLAVAYEESGDPTEKAASTYRRAADLGHMEAVMKMIDISRAASDSVTACKYLQIACDANRIEATYSLAQHYEQGEGVQCDPVQAFKLYRKAANAGHVMSKYHVGHYYCSGIQGYLERDFEKARSYFYEASELDHIPSITSLGWLHEHGKLNVQQNIERALEYYQRAAALGEPTAWYNVGIIYLQGREPEIPRDKEKGKQYLEKARDLGEKRAAQVLKQLILKKQYKEELETLGQIYRGEIQIPGLDGEHIGAEADVDEDDVEQKIKLLRTQSGLNENLP